MEPGTITLDRESFKALASEVRVEILKQLDDHRQTVTDLSKSLNLAKPTLLEHLDRLVAANLVVKKDEGRKWIYYELTRRGRHVLRPHQVKILISLALSFALFAAGTFAMLAATSSPGALGTETEPRIAESAFDRGVAVATQTEPGVAGLVLFAFAAALLALAVAFYVAQRSLHRSSGSGRASA